MAVFELVVGLERKVLVEQPVLGRPVVNRGVRDGRLDVDERGPGADVRRHDEHALAHLGTAAALGRKQVGREDDRLDETW